MLVKSESVFLNWFLMRRVAATPPATPAATPIRVAPATETEAALLVSRVDWDSVTSTWMCSLK